jgi:hypothetical protein
MCGMGINIGMNIRKMVYAQVRCANVAQDHDCGEYGICGVVCMGSIEHS